MADNIMGGYGSSDITANIEVNLNNIDRSTQDAATLASQLKDWGSSIEAANKQLQDYNTTQSEMLQTASDLADAHEKIVNAARELREISAASNVNLRDMAQNAREIQSALSGLGGASGAPYIPGMSSASPASVIDSSLSPGMGMSGAPEATPADFGMSGGGGGGIISSLVNASIIGNSGNRGSSYPSRPNGTVPDNGSPNSPVSTKGSGDEGLSYGESKAKQLLGINYWMPGGKTAALGRYIDRISGGSVTKTLGGYIGNHPRIFGSPGSEFGGPGSDAFTKSMMDSGIGPMTAEQAAMLPQSAYSHEVSQAMSRATIAAEAEGGIATAGTAGLMGKLGGLMRVGAPIAAAAYVGQQAYNAYATYSQQGQLLGSLTGENNSGKMIGYEVGDFLASLGNPRLSYGTAKEITMTGLGAGYQGEQGFGLGYGNNPGGGKGLLGQYTGFASNAYQNYGISPQESLSMFQSGIIQANATVGDLTSALNTLAQTSAVTNTSFTILKEQFNSFLSGIAAVGGKGSDAIQLATANALTNQNNPLLQGAGSTASMLTGQVGQALVAQKMGVSYTQMFNISRTPGGLKREEQAANAVFLDRLRNMGITPGMPNLDHAVGSIAYALPEILTQLGITNPAGGAWNENTAFEYTKKALSNGGQGENVDVGAGNEIKNLMKQFTGGKTGEEAVRYGLNSIAKEIGKTTTLGRDNQIFITSGGKHISMNEVYSMSLKDQSKIFQDLTSGKDKITVGTAHGQWGEETFGKEMTLAKLYGNQTLAGLNNGSITKIELGPEAAKLFKLINDPTQLSNQDTQNRSRFGYTSNTRQN